MLSCIIKQSRKDAKWNWFDSTPMKYQYNHKNKTDQFANMTEPAKLLIKSAPKIPIPELSNFQTNNQNKYGALPQLKPYKVTTNIKPLVRWPVHQPAHNSILC
eukprot:233980_1